MTHPLNQGDFVMFDDVFGEDLERILVRVYLGKLGKEISLNYSRNENLSNMSTTDKSIIFLFPNFPRRIDGR